MKKIYTYNSFINENLRDKLKGKTDYEIGINYLKQNGYNIDDKFSIALMNSEFNKIDKELLKTITVEELKNYKDSRFTKNIIGTLPELIKFFKSSNLIRDVRNIIRLMKKVKSNIVNESLKDKLRGKSEDDLMDNLYNMSPIKISHMSVENKFLKGFELGIKLLEEVNALDYITLYNLLNKAINNDFYDAIKILIDKGADINDQSLIIATSNNNYKTINLLLKSKEFSQYVLDQSLLNSSYNEDTKVVDLLLSYGANIESLLRDINGLKPFLSKEDEKKILKVYHKYKNLNESLKDKLKGKLIDDALYNLSKLEPEEQLKQSIKFKNLDIIIYVINNNDFDIDTLNSYFTLVINYCGVDVVQYFINLGCDVNIDGGDPLIWAIEDEDYDVVKLLIDKGADIHIENEKPLKTACRVKNYEITKLLLDSGADPSIDIFEPLTIARELEDVEIQRLLIKYIDKKIHKNK